MLGVNPAVDWYPIQGEYSSKRFKPQIPWTNDILTKHENILGKMKVVFYFHANTTGTATFASVGLS